MSIKSYITRINNIKIEYPVDYCVTYRHIEKCRYMISLVNDLNKLIKFFEDNHQYTRKCSKVSCSSAYLNSNLNHLENYIKDVLNQNILVSGTFYGSIIKDAVITALSEDGSDIKETTSDETGKYKFTLKKDKIYNITGKGGKNVLTDDDNDTELELTIEVVETTDSANIDLYTDLASKEYKEDVSKTDSQEVKKEKNKKSKVTIRDRLELTHNIGKINPNTSNTYIEFKAFLKFVANELQKTTQQILSDFSKSLRERSKNNQKFNVKKKEDRNNFMGNKVNVDKKDNINNTLDEIENELIKADNDINKNSQIEKAKIDAAVDIVVKKAKKDKTDIKPEKIKEEVENIDITEEDIDKKYNIVLINQKDIDKIIDDYLLDSGDYLNTMKTKHKTYQLVEDIIIHGNKYFKVNSDNVTFDGNNHTITIDNYTKMTSAGLRIANPKYHGLFKNDRKINRNGSNNSKKIMINSSYNNIVIKNIKVNVNSNITLYNDNGWIGRKYYGYNSRDCLIERCTVTGPVSHINSDRQGAISGANTGRVLIKDCVSYFSRSKHNIHGRDTMKGNNKYPIDGNYEIGHGIGTLKYYNLEGGLFGIENGVNKYHVLNLQDFMEIEKDDKKKYTVKFNFYKARQLFTIKMWGTPIYLVSIDFENTKPPEETITKYLMTYKLEDNKDNKIVINIKSNKITHIGRQKAKREELVIGKDNDQFHYHVYSLEKDSNGTEDWINYAAYYDDSSDTLKKGHMVYNKIFVVDSDKIYKIALVNSGNHTTVHEDAFRKIDLRKVNTVTSSTGTSTGTSNN